MFVACAPYSLSICSIARLTIDADVPRQPACTAANERVAVLIVAENAGLWFRFLRIVNDANIRVVNLPTTGERPDAFEELEKAAPVLVNIFRFVFIEAGKVQR